MEPVEIAQSHNFLDMLLSSGPVVMAVLWILIFLSIWSWTITIAKIGQFRRARRESEEFLRIFWETRNLARVDDSTKRLSGSPLTRVFLAGYRELSHIIQDGSNTRSSFPTEVSSIERMLRRAELEETVKLEKGNTFLASVASSAPFIGLFGTVWGIMTAFQGLASAKSTTIQAVAPGISEALIATAIGLAAAIPAAVAFNYFAVALRHFRESMNRFTSEFLVLAERQLVK